MESAAGPKERALDRRGAQLHPLADLAVGESLQLSQDDDATLGCRQLVERCAEVLEALALGYRSFGSDGCDELESARRALGVEGRLLHAAASPVMVDRGVSCDLVDPRLE